MIKVENLIGKKVHHMRFTEPVEVLHISDNINRTKQKVIFKSASGTVYHQDIIEFTPCVYGLQHD